jgi:hypothetical protein
MGGQQTTTPAAERQQASHESGRGRLAGRAAQGRSRDSRARWWSGLWRRHTHGRPWRGHQAIQRVRGLQPRGAGRRGHGGSRRREGGAPGGGGDHHGDFVHRGRGRIGFVRVFTIVVRLDRLGMAMDFPPVVMFVLMAAVGVQMRVHQRCRVDRQRETHREDQSKAEHFRAILADYALGRQVNDRRSRTPASASFEVLPEFDSQTF